MSLLTCATSSTPQMSKLAGPWYVHCTQKKQITSSLQLTADQENHSRRRNVKETKPIEYSLRLHIICTIPTSESYLCPGLQLKLRDATRQSGTEMKSIPTVFLTNFSFVFPWEKCKQRNGNMFPINENKVHKRDTINHIKWNQDVKIHEQIRDIKC
jgi:hypothetical protein